MRKNITPEEKAYRDKLVEAAAQKHGWRLLHDTVMRMFDGSALYEIALTNRRHRNHIYSSDWEYAEIYFDDVHYRHKNRDEADRIGYGVVSVRLPRKLPNVLFDSIKHSRQQFGPELDQKQRISLEGNFDASFATYFNEKYTIDSLSFITPEVMLALVEADHYDIEIMHDRLLLFGPVADDPEPAIMDMANRALAIKKTLMNNILTYRDERVPYSQGRKIVSRIGMFLTPDSKSLRKMYIIAIILLLILYTVVMIIIAQVTDYQIRHS